MRSGYFLTLGAALLLAGCGSKPADHSGSSAEIVDVAGGNEQVSPDNGVVNAVAPPVDTKADQESVSAVIDTVYASYEGRGVVSHPLTPDFKGAWDRVAGTEDALDYDPYCACQDYDATSFTHSIGPIQVVGDRARVPVTIVQMSNARDTHLWYDMLRTPKGWQIDDMAGEGGGSLKASLRAINPVSAPGGNED